MPALLEMILMKRTGDPLLVARAVELSPIRPPPLSPGRGYQRRHLYALSPVRVEKKDG